MVTNIIKSLKLENLKKIIFLCTGNSCRSQMAEGFAKQMFSNQEVLIESAGVRADGLNILAVKVMMELGIDIANQISKEIKLFNLHEFDLVFTVCDDAREACPVIDSKKIIHNSFFDPALSVGTIDEQLAIYREVRDQIQIFVHELFNNYKSICHEQN